MGYKAAIAMLVLACCMRANAQERNGKIVFYRESHFMESDYKPPLFCDGFELGRMLNGSYLEVVAKPGQHECVAETAQGPETTIDIGPGGVAYWRVVITQTYKRHAALTASNEEEYRRKKLTRIANAELDSVQPLVPVGPAPQTASTNLDFQEPSARTTDSKGVFHPGVDGVTYPHCVSCPDPGYTPQARAAKLNGTVELTAVIGADGSTRNIEIVKGIDKGLDEQAVNTIQKWRFQPAVGSNGEPVDVVVPIQVTFRLLN